MNADNVIKTIIIKSHFIGEDEVHKAGRPFLQQQAVIENNAISLASQHVSAADRTILTKAFIEKNKVRRHQHETKKMSAPIIDNSIFKNFVVTLQLNGQDKSLQIAIFPVFLVL